VSDPEVSAVLIKAAREKDTRRCLLLLGAILDTPGLAERLLEALRPEVTASGRRRGEDQGRESYRENLSRQNRSPAAGAQGRPIR
jgi:hypothetical protein